MRVGNICLQHNPGGDRIQTWAVQRLHEHFSGKRQVPVFFHIHVHELGNNAAILALERPLRSSAIQQFHPVTEGINARLSRDRRNLGINGGDFDRHDLNLRQLKRLQILFQSPICFLFAENRLA